ncbi:hypothetical protein CDL15_Pgr023688 [Punica granatum]|uniref:Uncharacterized protein n=1 Tax=Punica granatum TaxID=22663 RepID=A0A218XKI7_PUNGR|nr:hypothetical protein CDL15_Pgr023688 [Punica granatum]
MVFFLMGSFRVVLERTEGEDEGDIGVSSGISCCRRPTAEGKVKLTEATQEESQEEGEDVNDGVLLASCRGESFSWIGCVGGEETAEARDCRLGLIQCRERV